MLFLHKKGEVRKQLFGHQAGIDWLMTWLKQTGTEAFWWFDFQMHHCGKSNQNQNVVFVFVFVFVFVILYFSLAYLVVKQSGPGPAGCKFSNGSGWKHSTYTLVENL